MSLQTILIVLVFLILLVGILNLFGLFFFMAQDQETFSPAVYDSGHALEDPPYPITQPIKAVHPPPPAEAWVNNPTFHQLPAFDMRYIDLTRYSTARHEVPKGQFQQRLFLH